MLEDTTGIVEGQNAEARDMAGNLEYLTAQWANFKAETGKGLSLSPAAGTAGDVLGFLAQGQALKNEAMTLRNQVGDYLKYMHEMGALTGLQFVLARDKLEKLTNGVKNGRYTVEEYKAAILALLPGIDAVNAALGVEMPRNSALYAADVQAEKLKCAVSRAGGGTRPKASWPPLTPRACSTLRPPISMARWLGRRGCRATALHGQWARLQKGAKGHLGFANSSMERPKADTQRAKSALAAAVGRS